MDQESAPSYLADSVRRKGRIITSAGEKGGIGKTDVAVNVGVALSALGHNVCFVGGDPQHNLEKALGLGSKDNPKYPASRYTLVDALPKVDDDDPDPVDILECVMETQWANVWVVPSGRADLSVVAEQYRGSDRYFLYRPLMRRLATRFDYVIIDTPPTLGFFLINALQAAHLALIPISRGGDDINGAQATIKLIYDMKTSGANTNLVIRPAVFLNKYKKNTILSKAQTEVMKTMRAIQLEPPVPELEVVSQARAEGIPLFYYDKGSEATEAYVRLAIQIRQVLDAMEVRVVGDEQ